MARTGLFGRIPRAAPSLTNTLISIAREQRNQEDQNIMDAWQKGGLVDGKKVTDDVVLAYWRNRLTDIAKDDPLYDTYSDAVMQYEYSIAESKMTAKYALIAAPTAGDDTTMSSFYLNWAKKVPTDSEFYRVLQRDAGQYIRAAKAKQNVNTQAEIEKAYQAKMAAMEKANELPGQSVLKVLTLLGQQHGALAQSPVGDPTNVANATNLADATIGLGVDRLMAMLNAVTPMTPTVGSTDGGYGPSARNLGPAKATPNANVLFTNEAGKPVTGADIVAQFKALDPSFNGNFNMTYVQGLIAKQNQGLTQRIAEAKRTGHMTEAVSLESQQAKITEYGQEIAAWPVAQSYNDLHNQLQQTLNDAASGKLLPDAAAGQIASIRAKIGALANDPRIASDVRMQTQLRDEATGVAGTPTLAEDLSGTRTGATLTLAQGGDNAAVNGILKVYADQKKAVDAGTAVYTQGDYVKQPDGSQLFVPSTQGKSIGAADMTALNNLPGVGKPMPVMVPNGDGAGATELYVVPAPILASATAADGTALRPTNANPVGAYIKYTVNGKDVTLYTSDPKGGPPWTTDPPWDATKVKVSMGSNGAMNLDITGAVPGVQPADYNQNKDFGNGFAIQGAKQNADGTITPGQLVYDPHAAVLYTDGARVHAGVDPNTDSFSASIAAAKSVVGGGGLLSKWADDPRFQRILDQDAHLAAGDTLATNPDGTQGWQGGDKAVYAANLNKARTDILFATTDNPVYPLNNSFWHRTDTASALPTGLVPSSGTVTPTPNGGTLASATPPPAPSSGMLPSALLRANRADNAFNALTNTFVGNSNVVSTTPAPAATTPPISVGPTLTVPGLPGGSAFLPTPGAASTLTMPGSPPPAPSTGPGYGPSNPYYGKSLQQPI
jgi:hypothetical protein